MSKLIVMTDPHLVPAPGQIIGLDPAARLSQGLLHAAERHADADRLIIMGDLTNTGDATSYEALREALSKMPWPVTLMMGNHDHRPTFRKVFPDHPTDPTGFVQTLVDLDDVRIITLDSLERDSDVPESGWLCAERLDWLASALQSANRPCIVFIHHPPFMTGFSGMDGIALRNADAMRDVLKTGPVAHLFAGHVHRTITASIDGLSMTIFKSTCHQMPMLLGQEGFGHSVDEPGAYGIILTDGADVVVHFEDFTLPKQAVVQSSD